MKRHGFLLTSAKLLSMAFRPYYIPTVGLIALFTFTYLKILPWAYKLTVLLMVYSFTVILPRICVFVYRKINGWAPHQFRLREYRAIPYILFIISYIACLHLISIHSAGAGGIIGALIAYSILFMFNPIWWLCLMIVLSGAVGTSRMILRQHSLMQIVLGTIVGVVCGFGGIILT